MKKIIIGILICSGFILGITRCGTERQQENIKDKYVYAHTFNDGRIIHFTFDVPYNNDSLINAFSSSNILLDNFIEKLEYIVTFRDGGSKLYRYDKSDMIFGDEEFYIVVCNTVDNNKDIYVSKYKDNLIDNCSMKINDIDGLSMTIKEGTLSNSGVTIIITDISDKNNIYGEEYRIDKKINNEWISLEPIIDNYGWNSMGYLVSDDDKLEFEINWENIYGKIESGQYRLVKYTSEIGEEPIHYITVEFEIK